MIFVSLPIGADFFYDNTTHLINITKRFHETGQATGTLAGQELSLRISSRPVGTQNPAIRTNRAFFGFYRISFHPFYRAMKVLIILFASVRLFDAVNALELCNKLASQAT